MFSNRVHESFYIGALILLVVSLPYSVFTLSVAQITLAVNWILEGKWKQKWAIIKTSPALWAITIFYLVHLFWMINTSDFSWGVHELRLKLPLLVLPFILATSTPLSVKQMNCILGLFVAAVFTFSLYSGYLIFGFDGKPYHTMTELSPIIWHIRWALMVVLAIFLLIWLIWQNNHKKLITLLFPVILWLIVYLFLLKSLTGIVVLICTTLLLLGWITIRLKNILLKWVALVSMAMIFLIVASYLTKAYARFHTFEKVDFANLEPYTLNGNPYIHDTSKRYVENGHYIYLYISPEELSNEWNERSDIPLDIKVGNGYLKDYLIRYLTSKGLRKDSIGVSRLTERDIYYIESGKTNYIDTSKYALYPRIYVSIWELYHYKQGANPLGYSLAQRIEFLKTARNIIRDNFWFGVGTGDHPIAFARQFKADNSPIPAGDRWWANNQLVSFWVNFGLIGFALVLFSLIAPPLFEHKFSSYLFLSVFIIGFLSFLDEDTFETHPGISMFAIFYALFLFYKHDKTP